MKRLIVGAMLSLAVLVCGCGKEVGAMSETAATESGEAGGAAKEGEEEMADKESAEEEKRETVDGEEWELTAVELAGRMGNGINLGNTMEAYGHAQPGIEADVSAYETLWGQPETTLEMIAGMKAAGFDSIRIPVAWTNVMDYENENYAIRRDFMDRVETIVNYALQNDMYVIINDHWDGSWWGMFGSAKQETRDKAMELYVSMWSQIAERFRDYPKELIFESGNEELGDRLNDIDVCADSGALTEDECYEQTNRINQTFVDTIRKDGGNNEQRFLLIAGYNTDIERTCDERFIMPKDSAANKLLVSVHYYTPWGYCGTESVDNWGTIKNYEEQNKNMEMMTKFTKQGYGVVIGEYAVLVKADGTIKENTGEFITNMLDNCDLYGYCPMLWDCNNLYSKAEAKLIDEEIAEIFANRSIAARQGMTEEDIISNVKEGMEAALAPAPEAFDLNIDLSALDKPMAWIMFNSNDWNVTYSAGDIYDPESATKGVSATDVEITGEGTYTVGLDFTGTEAGSANGTGFSALAVSSGELLFPGYTVTIKEILINGKTYEWQGKPYTASDDGKCTRVNLYNGWVKDIPSEARTEDGNLTDATAVLLDNEKLGQIKTLFITFDYKEGEAQ